MAQRKVRRHEALSCIRNDMLTVALALIASRYGDDFAAWFNDEVTDIEFLDDLARKKGVVLMYGPGFDAPDGCVRVSLANPDADDYIEIARRMGELLDEYHAQYQKGAALDTAA